MSIHISVENNHFDNGSSVIGTLNEGKSQDPNEAILKELQEIRSQLDSTDRLWLEITKLEEAIQKHNEPQVAQVVKVLKSDFPISVLSNLASTALLKFLGL